MLQIADRLGAPESARAVWNDMEEFGIEPSGEAYLALMRAHGHAGDIDGMKSAAAAARADATVSISLEMIKCLLLHYGKAQARAEIDSTYDMMLEEGLEPDAELNRILIHACNIDAISVVANSPIVGSS